MKIGKTTLIIIAVIVAAIIMFYVWKKNTDAANTPVVLTARVQQLVDRVPYETRKKIVDSYTWFVTNGDVLILRDGKVFNNTKNQPDQYGRTSIERVRLDAALWDVKNNLQLIDGSTEWWLGGNTMKFTLAEFQQSLQVK